MRTPKAVEMELPTQIPATPMAGHVVLVQKSLVSKRNRNLNDWTRGPSAAIPRHGIELVAALDLAIALRASLLESHTFALSRAEFARTTAR